MSLKTGKDLEERNSAGRLLQGNEGITGYKVTEWILNIFALIRLIMLSQNTAELSQPSS